MVQTGRALLLQFWVGYSGCEGQDRTILSTAYFRMIIPFVEASLLNSETLNLSAKQQTYDTRNKCSKCLGLEFSEKKGNLSHKANVRMQPNLRSGSFLEVRCLCFLLPPCTPDPNKFPVSTTWARMPHKNSLVSTRQQSHMGYNGLGYHIFCRQYRKGEHGK